MILDTKRKLQQYYKRALTAHAEEQQQKVITQPTGQEKQKSDHLSKFATKIKKSEFEYAVNAPTPCELAVRGLGLFGVCAWMFFCFCGRRVSLL